MSKTILITGATDGIGLQTARALSEAGHRVLLHGRDTEKLADARSQMNGMVETFRADLADIDAVKRLADAVARRNGRLDVLINNAGVFKTAQSRVQGGEDVRFLVNTAAPYVLTIRLLQVLGKNGRVINLSSAAQARMDLPALSGGHATDAISAYAQSKLGITIWTQMLAREYPEGPSFHAINPGSLLATKMVREGFGTSGKDVGQGVDILLRAALSDEFAGHSGDYFDNDSGRFAPPNPAARDPRQQQDLMTVLKGYL